MSSTNSEKNAAERREVVVEVLAQAVLDLILDERADAGREPQPEPPRRAATTARAPVVTEAAHAAG